MSDIIPFEMQVEIMKRLPVKSLVTFRSVSKAWKSVIDSRRFITNQTNMRRHHRLLLRNVPLSLEQLTELETVGTSLGLLCLSGIYRVGDCYKKTAVIWNPSLTKSVAIDIPYQHKRSSVTSIGFGVRPDNCDPMIVRVSLLERPCRVMVFTLRSRVWRAPRGNLLPESIDFTFSCPTATDDRCIYWKGYNRGTGINLVVVFDMVSEVFTEINLPRSVAHQYYQDFSISTIKDSLALLEYYDDAKKPVCDVWMMVEDGVSKSFTKLFTVNTPDPSLMTKVLGFRMNYQPVVETTKRWPSTSVEVYEPQTGTVKNLGINVEHGSFFCCSYTETLLLLDQLDGQFIEIQMQL
uniref:putative F-box protein At5g50220 n=1 Tax=Erigeron canadensis TaxID=72917 RepID=UPI001CB8ECBD|nr:putative F-box protein At5g50220 [Erigeron canadensis]